MLLKIGRNLAEILPKLADIGQGWSKLTAASQIRPGSAQIWPKSAKYGRIRPKNDHIWLKSAKTWPNWTDVG